MIKNGRKRSNVIFNFKTENKFKEFISNLLSNNNDKSSGKTMFYIGYINYYEKSNTYFLYSTDENYEIFLGE